jgi:hypothetical protein
MRPAAPLSIIVAVAGLALPSCAAEGDFPSLAMRPAERDRSVEEPVRPSPQVPDDAALRRRLGELTEAAAEGERAFDAAFGPADAAVDAAGAAESERWVAAQQALSRLEAAREPTTRALAELDRLAVDRADLPTGEADRAALEAAIAAVERIAAGQQARIDGLRERLSGP